MNPVPAPLALAIGALFGALVYPPVRRWIDGLRRAIREAQDAPESAPRPKARLLAIFVTMHPAPWLILIGIPYVLYRAWTDPFKAMWLALLAGAIGVPLLMWRAQARRQRRAGQDAA